MFTYDVLTDEQEKEERKGLSPGKYKFRVDSAEEAVSKSGNDMLVLTLRVFGENGRIHIIKDWLVNIDGMKFKIKHFWECVGKPNLYSGGNTIADYKGNEGMVEIRTNKNKATGEERLQVYDYIVPSHDDLEDDIGPLPF